jgi:hypothetical protein
MTPMPGRQWFDPLQLFAVSIALMLAALLFLAAILANVSFETAAIRAVLGWGVLSLLGVGLTVLVRWVLRVPPPGDGTRLDVTIQD